MADDMKTLGNVAIPTERYDKLSQQDKDVLIATLVSKELTLKHKERNLDKVLQAKEREISRLEQELSDQKEAHRKEAREWVEKTRVLLDCIRELVTA